jgi:RNA polymerase sigma-70 factor (ECF subfamily)
VDAEIDRLIELHSDRAFAIARRMTGNDADAGDVVQEALLRAIKYMKSYDPNQPFEAWLGQIIRNVYINSVKLEARRRQVPLAYSALEGEDGEALTLEQRLPDPEPGPERLAQARSDSDEVQDALAELGPTTRMAVILADIEGLEREDCARALGCSLSAFDVRLHRGRAQLRKRLVARGRLS